METAVSLTKDLRWGVQSLGVRIQKTAGAEELSHKKLNRSRSRAAYAAEIRRIIQGIRELLSQIDYAVPFISLAIQTSGESLSRSLPPTVSPSRLLQASSFISDGDMQFNMSQGSPVQIGPLFTLTLYMLFAGHSYRVHDEERNIRDTTWKEVIHKARAKLVRSSGDSVCTQGGKDASNTPISSIEREDSEIPVMPTEGSHTLYSYHLEIIEDFDDDRVHSFEEDETHPGPYGGVELAGIREKIPVYQFCNMFYADTGKLLNIGSEGETNNPVLLIKRNINALPSRQMMQESEKSAQWDEYEEDHMSPSEEEYDSQEDINEQIRRESSVHLPAENILKDPVLTDDPWALPADLDPEWMALEIYTEAPSSVSDDEQESDDATYVPERASLVHKESNEESLTDGIAQLNLSQDSSSSPSIARQRQSPRDTIPSFSPRNNNQYFSPMPIIRSSISLLEMLLRLAVCQQYEQMDHRAVMDETLNFFLHENASTGAGENNTMRQRARQAAKTKVGFDPYNESPIKRRIAPFEEQDEGGSPGQMRREEDASYGDRSYDDQYSRRGTPYMPGRGFAFTRGATPYSEYSDPRLPSPSLQGTPEWLRRSRESSSRNTPEIHSSSPASPYRPQRKKVPAGPLDRVQRERTGETAKGISLGRGISVDTDSSLGTSPGSPTLVDRAEKL